MKGIKENQIMVLIKEPGEDARVEPLFDNTLEAFQKTVGGYIETVTVDPGLVIICNEEGRLKGLPFNVELLGIGFVGTIVIAGVRGDEFASLKSSVIPRLLAVLGNR